MTCIYPCPFCGTQIEWSGEVFGEQYERVTAVCDRCTSAWRADAIRTGDEEGLSYEIDDDTIEEIQPGDSDESLVADLLAEAANRLNEMALRAAFSSAIDSGILHDLCRPREAVEAGR